MKFTIRDLFLVTMIVALVLGWLVDHRRAAAAKHEVEKDASALANQLCWSGYVHSEFIDARVNRYKPMYQKNFFPELPEPSAPAPNPPKP